MVPAVLVMLAVIVWTAGACLYTAALWPARGVTDAGAGGLLVMIAGSGLLAWALLETAALALCVLLPAVFAASLLAVKLQARIRARWRRPPPMREAMLSRVSVRLPRLPATPRMDAALGSSVPREARDLDRLFDAEPMQRWDQPPLESELDRAQRIGKMFS
jgi:hypothetical protein